MRKKLDDKGKKMLIAYFIGGYKLYDEEKGRENVYWPIQVSSG